MTGACCAARVAQLRAALPASVKLHYAMKANPMPAVVGLMAGLVDGIDVASGGELQVALNAGADPAEVSFAGPGKRDIELRQAVAAGVLVNVESARELPVLAAASQRLGLPARVAVRVNPDFELKGSGMKMGGGPKQFGIDTEQLPELLADVGRLGLAFEGFHLFAGSQNLRPESICEAQQKSYELALRLAALAPSPVKFLNLGGGFGIPYFPGEQVLDLAPIGANLQALVERAAAEMPQASLVIELGRYLVGEAGVYVTRIVDRKLSRGQVYLVTDGGLNHHLAASGNFGQVVRKNYPVTVSKIGQQGRQRAARAGFRRRPAVHAAGPAGRPHGPAGGRDRRSGRRVPVRCLWPQRQPGRFSGAPGLRGSAGLGQAPPHAPVGARVKTRPILIPMTSPMSPSEARTAVESGITALRAGDARAARQYFDPVVAAGLADVDALLGLAYACGNLGDAAAALAAVDAALKREPRHLRALMLRADLSAAAGDDRAAASFYRAVVKASPSAEQLPLAMRQERERAEAMCQRYAQKFEAQLHQKLDSVGVASERFKHSLDLLYGRKQIYRQDPRLYYFPELPQIQFYPRADFPWLDRLEAATDEIRSELQSVLQDEAAFAPYVQGAPNRPNLSQGGMLNNPDWSAFYLWKDGAPVPANAARCPRTMEALAEVPLCRMPGRGPAILFSLLRPGARIPAHTGFLNTRLICHLPLIVPPQCGFRVGNDTREWVEGKAWLFDDTIEHEAWNNSKETRVVLLFEVWRPELDEGERAMVSAMFEAIDQQQGRSVDWGI